MVTRDTRRVLFTRICGVRSFACHATEIMEIGNFLFKWKSIRVRYLLYIYDYFVVQPTYSRIVKRCKQIPSFFTNIKRNSSIMRISENEFLNILL